ncbi:acyltransferase 3 [Aspergillus karnatakaensis]|uniref:acyltransferase 3 n=1 Tax=Aspergillus karnatakaensis TaxID=1810916 RepID=UPI003CCD6CEB
MARVLWVDGLKGMAAFLVAFNHYFKGFINDHERSFWDSPPEENRLWIQLPPFRLLWASHSMVPLFMVLSGYSLSLGLLKVRDTGRTFEFLLRVRRAIFRRPIRLYIPVIILAVLCELVFFFNLNFLGQHWITYPPGASIWTILWIHTTNAVGYVADNMNIVDFLWNRGLNDQVWTMSLEFRGSYAVFLAILALSPFRRDARLCILTAISCFHLWYGNWDTFSFISGVHLAELTSSSPTPTSTPTKTASHSTTPSIPHPKPKSTHTNLLSYPSLLIGLYFLCLNGEGSLPPEYAFLDPIRTRHWTRYNIYVDQRFTWQAIGAVAFVYAIANNRLFQRPFLTAPLQYLGRLHLGIYILHILAFNIWREPFRDGIFRALAGQEYPEDHRAGELPGAFWGAWVGSGVAIAGIVLVGAEVLNAVLVRCFAVVDRVEERFLERKGVVEKVD